MKSARGKSQRSSGGTQTTASIQTAVSVFTTESGWSPWTWFLPTLRRPAPGWLGWNTLWLVSAMKTVWPGGSVHVINILYQASFTHNWSLKDELHQYYCILFTYTLLNHTIKTTGNQTYPTPLRPSQVNSFPELKCYMATTDFLWGWQKWRWHAEHWRGSPAAPQTQREPTQTESQADVSSKS